MLLEAVDLELDDAAVGTADFLGLEVDGERRVRAAARVVEKLVDVGLGKADRQNAVLEAVVVEDIGERRGDDAADAEIEERPGGMLAGGAAAEVVARDQDLGLLVGLLVEDEVGVFLAVLVIAQLEEQRLAEPGPLDRLQKLLGMIMSVSMLRRGKGAATPVSFVNLSMIVLPAFRPCS